MADEDQKEPRKTLLSEAESRVERHPEQTYPVRVAPSFIDDDAPLNSIRPALMSVACWRLDDAHFDFDSSFILPKAATDLRRLGELREDYHESPMSIFGHADPVGSDTYNKKLSGNRARALFALLVRDFDAWEELFNEHGWGLRSTQIILMHLDELEEQKAPPPAANTPPAATKPEDAPFKGPADGKDTTTWRNAVRRFQKAQGLGVDGAAGKNTRAKLYELYMDALTAKTDDGSESFEFERNEFLGKNQDPKGKAAFQGCSEFNPIVLLSDEDNKLIDEGPEPRLTRNQRNAPNRRVVLYFFPPGLEIEPSQWPCPRASEGPAGCKKRFWSDHERRLKPDAQLTRAYGPIPGQPLLEPKQDTFGCRFYDRLARRSPCEAGFHEWIVQLLYPGEETLQVRPRVAGAKFVAEGGTGRTEGITDENGLLRIRVRDATETITVKVQVPLGEPQRGGGDSDSSSSNSGGNTQSSAPPQGTTTLTLTLNGGKLTEIDNPATRDQAIDDRLRSLGFGPLNGPLGAKAPRDPLAAIDAFKKLEKLTDSDNLDEVVHDRYGS